ncbi:MAG: hypothetical protein J6K21_02830 [Bacilli bacterium]|nr:hypothetical protein [Bacilli bacterium]
MILDRLKSDIKGNITKINYDYYSNGTIIYYNPIEDKICNDYIEENSETGVKTGCLKWYVFNDNKNNSMINMILDHNITALVTWNSSGNNADGMNEVKTALEEDTKGWKQTARLITADEVAKITGANETLKWNSNLEYVSMPIKGTSVSYFYFDGKDGTDTLWHTQVANETQKSKYSWLYDNTEECLIYGCLKDQDGSYGYWTSTPVKGFSDSVYHINRSGYINKTVVNNAKLLYGVRPVIKINKPRFKIVLRYDDKIEVKYTNKSTETFTINAIKQYTNIYSNNGTTVNYNDGNLVLNNITESTEVIFSNSLVTTSKNIDDSKNYVLLINDNIETASINFNSNKNIYLDLAGYKISSNTNTIVNKGNLTIDSSKENGEINTTGENTKTIYNTSTTANLLIKNAYIKGTNNCNVWSCTPIYNIDSSNIEITPKTGNRFDSNNDYINGVYIESFYGINTWIASSSTAIINGGTFKTNADENEVSWQNLVCSNCNNLTINYAKTIGDGAMIRSQGSGEIIVNDGDFTSLKYYGISTDANSTGKIIINGGNYINYNLGTIHNIDGTIIVNNGNFANLGSTNGFCVAQATASNGNIILNGGTFKSLTSFTIYNYSSNNASIDINQTNKPIYITTLAKDWHPAIYNSSSGIINIKGNIANKCTASVNDTTTGLCVYAEGNGDSSSSNGNGAVQNRSTGSININGGTYYGLNQGINNGTNGNLINIKNAKIISGYTGILNNDTGTINICNSQIISSYPKDLINISTGIINYSSNVIFSNGTNVPVVSNKNGIINSNYTGTCQS